MAVIRGVIIEVAPEFVYPSAASAMQLSAEASINIVYAEASSTMQLSAALYIPSSTSGFYSHIKDELLFPWIQREGQTLSRSIVKLFSQFWDVNGADCLYVLRQFHVAACADKYLPNHGVTRRLAKRDGETDDDYRARLLDAWYIHSLSGRVAGIKLALRQALPDIAVTVSVPGGGSGWRIGSGRVGTMTIGMLSARFEVLLAFPDGTSAADRTAAYNAVYAVKAARDKIVLQEEITPPTPSPQWKIGTSIIGSMRMN